MFQLRGSLFYQPKQCIVIREIPENYHRFVLFDSPKMGNLTTPALPRHAPQITQKKNQSKGLDVWFDLTTPVPNEVEQRAKGCTIILQRMRDFQKCRHRKWGPSSYKWN